MDKFANDYVDFGFVLPPDVKADPKGEVNLICPQCDYLRKKKGEKKLRVNVNKGTWFCVHCGWTGGLTPIEWAKDKPHLKASPYVDMEGKQLKYWTDRGISSRTLAGRMVRGAMHNVRDKASGEIRNVLCTVFTYTYNGWPVMIKYRDGKKNYAIQKDSKLIPWGLDWIKKSKTCIITEGEPDCLSYHECGLFNVVSVPNGVTISKEEKELYEKTGKLVVENTLSLSYFDSCYEEFETKECIYIATDADAAGVKLRMEIARRFGTDRCKYINFSRYTYLDESGKTVACKDANDVLRYIGAETLKDSINHAENFPVEDVVTIDDVWNEIEFQIMNGLEYGLSTGISDLDPHFTWKVGHCVALNGHNNMGKTIFAINLILLSAFLYDWKWGVYSPENYPISDMAIILLEIVMGNTMDRTVERCANPKQIEYARKFIREHVEFVNNEDGYDPPKLREVKKQMIRRRGIRGFFTDPWNSLIQDLKGDTMDNYLTKELSAEVRFSTNHKIIQLFDVHPPTPIGIEKREPQDPSEYQITGGGVWSKRMHEIMSIHYDKKMLSSGNFPLSQIRCLKTKDHRLIGIPNRENPVLLKFNTRCHRFTLKNGTDPFEKAKRQISQTLSFESF